MGIFSEGEDSRGDHGLGRLVKHYILLCHHSHHRENVTAPHGRDAHEAMPRREDHEVHKDMWWHYIYISCKIKILDLNYMCTYVARRFAAIPFDKSGLYKNSNNLRTTEKL